MTADPGELRRPYSGADAHECRRHAEDLLAHQNASQVGFMGRAIAWALLAIAAELRIIRKLQRRER